MSGAAVDSLYCPPCDIKFQNDAEFENHRHSKKHKNNERIAGEKAAAGCSIVVYGLKGIEKLEQFLASYFCKFGLLAKVSSLGPKSHGIGKVQFADPGGVEKVLQVGPKHAHDGYRMRVSKFEYKPQHSDALRLSHEEEMRKSQTSRKELHTKVCEFIAMEKVAKKQMKVLVERLQLTKKEVQDRFRLAEDLRLTCSEIYPECSVYQFGSSLNGFGTHGCDLDLFLNIDMKEKDSNKLIMNLAKFLSSRKLSQIYGDVLSVPSSRCPIVKFVHKPTGIKCDLSLDNKKALYNSRLLLLYSSLSFVRQLVFMVRLWAKFRGLSGCVGGSGPTTLSSYALTMLVVFYCVQRKLLPGVTEICDSVSGVKAEVFDECHCLIIPEDARLPESKIASNPVKILHGFFKYFSEEIDWERDALLTRDARIVPKATLIKGFRYAKCKIHTMTVVDPFNLSHNIAGNVNEHYRQQFVEELKRGAHLVENWLAKDNNEEESQNVKPSGLIELFELADLVQHQPRKDDRRKTGAKAKKGKDPQKAEGETPPTADKPWGRLEGELDNGEFHIVLPAAEATLADKDMIESAEGMGLTAQQYWLGMAQDFTVNVLETVFCVEMKECDNMDTETGPSPMETGSNSEIVETTRMKRPSGDIDVLQESETLKSVSDDFDSGEMPKKRYCDGIRQAVPTCQVHTAIAPTTVTTNSIVTSSMPVTTSCTTNAITTYSSAIFSSSAPITTTSVCATNTTMSMAKVAQKMQSESETSMATMTNLPSQSIPLEIPLDDCFSSKTVVSDSTISNTLNISSGNLPSPTANSHLEDTAMNNVPSPTVGSDFEGSTMNDVPTKCLTTSAMAPVGSTTTDNLSTANTTANDSPLLESTDAGTEAIAAPKEKSDCKEIIPVPNSRDVWSVRSLACVVRKQVWVGRKKFKKELLLVDHFADSADTNVILLEREITRRTLKEQDAAKEKLLQCMRNFPQASHTSQGKSNQKTSGENAISSSDKPNTSECHKNSMIPGKDKLEAKVCESIVNSEYHSNGTEQLRSEQKILPSSQSGKDLLKAPLSPLKTCAGEMALPFSCDLISVNPLSVPSENEDGQEPPYLLIKIKPDKRYISQFKNFYESFRSMMLRLNVSDLNFKAQDSQIVK